MLEEVKIRRKNRKNLEGSLFFQLRELYTFVVEKKATFFTPHFVNTELITFYSALLYMTAEAV